MRRGAPGREFRVWGLTEFQRDRVPCSELLIYGFKFKQVGYMGLSFRLCSPGCGVEVVEFAVWGPSILNPEA